MILPKEQCCATVYRSDGTLFGDTHRCTRRGVMTHRGKLYCKLHDPVARTQKDQARMEEFDRRNQAELASARLLKAAPRMLAAIEAALPVVIDESKKRPAPEWDSIVRSFRDAIKGIGAKS